MNKPSNEIIEKVFDGLATTEDAKDVAEWLATDEGQIYLSQRIDSHILELKEGYEDIHVDHEIPSDKIYYGILSYIRRKRMRRLPLRAAAVIIPFIFILGLGWLLNSRVDLFGSTEYAEIYVPKGERIQMMFQDGSHVYLNSDTRLRYPKKFSLFERKVFIDGEGYFVVEKNPDRPFIVQMGDHMVKVYGTSFDVKAYSESDLINIALDNGSIGFIPFSKGKYDIKPGEKLIYDKKTGECRISREQDTKSASLWKKDILSFKNTPLEEVIRDLNRWYNIQFIVEDPRAYNYSYTITYTGTAENTSLEKVLSDLEKISPVKFTRNEKQVTISMK